MIKKLSLALITSVCSLAASAGTLTVEGSYQGKNIYIQNPFVNNGVGFCAFEVIVNDKTTTDEVNSSSFEVDLSALKLSLGERVVIKVKYKDDCKPRVVNPEDLKVKSTYELVPKTLMYDAKEGIIKWTTKGETGKLPFIVEQYRWNKWVKVDEVEGKGRIEGAFYSVKYKPHSGENKIRVKQVDVNGPRFSEAIKVRSIVAEVKPKKLDNLDKLIEFSDDTRYEIFDMYGNVVLKGFGNEVDVQNLKKGTYYINYDNKTGDKFTKK